MTVIESKKVQVNHSAKDVHTFLMNMENLYHLLPQDAIDKFESTADNCSFKVKGTIMIALEIDKANSNDDVVIYKTTSSAAFEFVLKININSLSENETEVFEICEAKLNPFLKMMVEPQLGKLFDYIAGKLPEALAK